MKRALRWVVNIILALVVVMAVSIFILPRFGGFMFDVVLSGSMEPELSVGGVLAIKPVESRQISVGDIVAYSSGGEKVIAHRVIEVQPDGYFITKGDANEDPDVSPVPASSVVGEVFFHLPYLGYAAAFVKTRLGFLLTILIPGLAIISLELKSMWQGVLERKKERPVVRPVKEVRLKEVRPPKFDRREAKTVNYNRPFRIDRFLICTMLACAVILVAVFAFAFFGVL